MTADPAKKPSVLFVCVHNAGRSQMAAAFLTSLSRGAIEVRSAGSQPAEAVNPAAEEDDGDACGLPQQEPVGFGTGLRHGRTALDPALD